MTVILPTKAEKTAQRLQYGFAIGDAVRIKNSTQGGVVVGFRNGGAEIKFEDRGVDLVGWCRTDLIELDLPSLKDDTP